MGAGRLTLQRKSIGAQEPVHGGLIRPVSALELEDQNSTGLEGPRIPQEALQTEAVAGMGDEHGVRRFVGRAGSRTKAANVLEALSAEPENGGEGVGA